MGWDLDVTVGKLHRFWWWCVDYAEDGDLRKHNDGALGGSVGLNGDAAKNFVQAMLSACWLDRSPYFRIHDWWDYFGIFLQIRYKRKPERWKEIRDKCLQKDTKKRNGARNGSGNAIPNQPNLTNQPPIPPEGALNGFEKFWDVYPQRGRERCARNKCEEFWIRRDLAHRSADIQTGLELWIQCEMWQKDDGQYVKNALSWLRGEMYLQKPGRAQPKALVNVSGAGKWQDKPYTPG